MTANNFNLRGVPGEVMTMLQKEAKKLKISVNSLILKMLEQGVGLGGKPKRIRHHDLDFLIGTWSSSDAKVFDDNVKVFEKIDEELWK